MTLVVFTGGETAYSTPEGKATIVERRSHEMEACDRVLGIDRRIRLGKPTQGVVNDRETYPTCVRIIRDIRPDVIITHAHPNKHRDHRAVAEFTDEARWKAGEAVLAHMGEPWHTPELYFFENHELFAWPSIAVDITPYFGKKMKAMPTQESPMSVLEPILELLEGMAVAEA